MGLEWGGGGKPPTDMEVFVLAGIMIIAVILWAVFR